jgi:hypothetical protein
MAKIMKPEPSVGVLDEMFRRFARSGELLGALTAFAVVPVRHDFERADFDDLAQQTGTHQRRPPDLRAEIQPPPVIDLTDHQIRRRPILGGLISEYQIAA